VSAATWVFDVDGCLVDSLTGTSLRPRTLELLSHLRGAGAEVVVWSAGGADYANDRLVDLGAAHLVDRFLSKEARGSDGRYEFAGATELAGTVFVDDRPEDLPVDADVVAVSPYLAPNPHDRGLAAAAARAGCEAPHLP
jgi:hypothetical protein